MTWQRPKLKEKSPNCSQAQKKTQGIWEKLLLQLLKKRDCQERNKKNKFVFNFLLTFQFSFIFLFFQNKFSFDFFFLGYFIWSCCWKVGNFLNFFLLYSFTFHHFRIFNLNFIFSISKFQNSKKIFHNCKLKNKKLNFSKNRCTFLLKLLNFQSDQKQDSFFYFFSVGSHPSRRRLLYSPHGFPKSLWQYGPLLDYQSDSILL